MKKTICLIMVCMLAFAMTVSAFAGDTYQVGTFKFTTDIALEHNYSNSELSDVSDGDFFEFTSEQLGIDEWVDEDGTEMYDYGELEICTDTTIEIMAQEEEKTFSGVSEYPSALEALKELWEGDTINEVTIDGCPGIVVQNSDSSCCIHIYDDTYFYTIELDAYEKAGYDKLYADLLKAELNCKKSTVDDVKEDEAKEDNSKADKVKDDNDTVSKEKVKIGNKTDNSTSVNNNSPVNNSSAESNDNTLVIVIGVVAVAAIAGIVIVLLKKKK